MSYKMYQDGEIWKDGRLYAKVYDDGIIYIEHKQRGRIYDDGEIYIDNKPFGKIYENGDIYINNKYWGKYVFNKVVDSPKKEEVYVENKKSSFNIPTPDVSGIDGGGVLLFIALGIVVLFIVLLPFAAFGQALGMWKVFTIDMLAYGILGVVAAGLLMLGTIIGVVTQYSKFNGSFIAGIIINTIIVMMTVLAGQYIIFGSYAFQGLNTDIVTFISTFALMAAVPTLFCKLFTLLAIKFNFKQKHTIKNNSKTVAPMNRNVQNRSKVSHNGISSKRHFKRSSSANFFVDDLLFWLEDEPLIVQILVCGIILGACGFFIYSIFTGDLFDLFYVIH